jgi:gamma-glutamylcyclotransferase (GGCT)/AIG2-like uncharacterized protein YtfP
VKLQDYNRFDLMFVYGTLREGFHANDMLAGAIKIGDAYTGPDYMLFGGSYPVMLSLPRLLQKDIGSVRGELWGGVTQEMMAKVDVYEGVPHLYIRKRITVYPLPTTLTGSQEGIGCWSYLSEKVQPGVHPQITPDTDGVLEWV